MVDTASTSSYNSKATQEAFDRAADLVDENAENLKKNVNALSIDVAQLTIPEAFWD